MAEGLPNDRHHRWGTRLLEGEESKWIRSLSLDFAGPRHSPKGLFATCACAGFAALNTVEPPIQNLSVMDLQQSEEHWAKLRRPGAVDAVKVRLGALSAWLDGRDYLVDRFTVLWNSTSSGVPFERLGARRQLHPRVSTAIVDRDPRRWEVRVGKRTYGDAHGFFVSLFGVEDVGPADRAEPEPESGTLIADADVLCGRAKDLERSSEACQRSEDTAGPLLTREAVAEANSPRSAFNLNAQLAAATRGCSGRH
jgi:hypothetical protein